MIVRRLAPALLALSGCGVLSAAKIVGEVAGGSRFRSPAAFARWNGVTTSGGTATAGTDYTAVGLTPVDFAAGETTKTVTVDITGDTVKEANETVNLVLSTAAGAVTSDTSGTATILNDD